MEGVSIYTGKATEESIENIEEDIFYDDDFIIVGCDNDESEKISAPSLTYWKDAMRRLRQNKIAIFSLMILFLIFIMTIIGPNISNYGFRDQDLSIAHSLPSSDHYFGTDELGRDIFARIWVGGRVSLLIGFVGTIISLLIGCTYGGICGYFGGKIDTVMMRIVEILVGIPYMIVVILASVVLGKGIVSLIVALCLTSWTGSARLIRGQIIQLKESEYVLAARVLGAKPWRIILKLLIPNTLGIIIVNMTFEIPGFIFSEAFLSFVGLGVQPPNTSWGAMASIGQQQMDFFPHELLFPALAISITMLAFNLLGDGLRDALDPKLRQ
jgi:oligopeptide transport system permease protein